MTTPKLISGDHVGNKIRMLESGASKAGGGEFKFMKIGAANAEITRLEAELKTAHGRIAELEAQPSNIKEIEASAQSLLNENRELRAAMKSAGVSGSKAQPKTGAERLAEMNGYARTLLSVQEDIKNEPQKLTGLARVTAAFQRQTQKLRS